MGKRSLVYFRSWQSRSALQEAVTLADKAVEAIDITLLADWTANDTWVYKFSVLTL